MATASMSADPSKLSFAKVAASAGIENVALAAAAKANNIPAAARGVRKENVPAMASNKKLGKGLGRQTEMSGNEKESDLVEDDGILPSEEQLVQEPDVAKPNLVDAIKALSVQSPMPSLVVNGSGTSNTSPKAESVGGFSEEACQREDSGSELGTKPASLDGKSITSGTTFALDEKESLRPDDSASVKAAEDDDTFSGRGSIVAGSRIGSEAAGRAYRAQMYDATDRRGILTLQDRQAQGVLTPQSDSSGQQIADSARFRPLVGAAGVPDAFNLFYRQTPDEKLLEALDSPKDRLFLLRLEQDVIEFVKDSKEPFFDLPPCNSFCRMLTHKLADYYHMTHLVDAVAGAVRIFRTPFCRLPPSLTTISNPPTSGSTPPPTLPPMKIMRRGGEGDTGPNASKAASETGSDGKDKSLSAKEKLSREEREAAYLKARERIFGADKTAEPAPDVEDVNDMSRSSSVSAKDKSGQMKKNKPAKQRRDDNDNFDVRSQYTPFFPQQTTPTWMPGPQFSPMPTQSFNGTVQTSYPNPLPQQFGPQNPQFIHPMSNNGGVQNYSNMPQQFSPNQQRYTPHSAPITSYGSPAQSPPMVPQAWQQPNVYQTQYQQPRAPPLAGPQSSIPYQYGQLPSTANPADPKSQHPIPGSFNRHAFNPKTQSFVPGSTGPSTQQPISHQGSPHHGSPHHGSPRPNYTNTYTPQQSQQPQFGSGIGYSMARQGSNNSLPSYHASPHMAHRQMQQGMPPGLPQGLPQNQGMMPQGIPQSIPQVMPHGMQHGMQQNIPQGMPQGMHIIPQGQYMHGMPQGNGQFGSNLPIHGNPSTLPPKPQMGI